MEINPSIAILVGAALATFGWMYTGRRGRTLAKKQHTITVMMKANFDHDFLEARTTVSKYIMGEIELPEDILSEKHGELRAHLRRVVNHYEFVAAGLRNGDFDERLVKDSERTTIVLVYSNLKKYIWNLRDGRDRMSIYEHLEWLHNRWEECPPNRFYRSIECLKGTPLYGNRNNKNK